MKSRFVCEFLPSRRTESDSKIVVLTVSQYKQLTHKCSSKSGDINGSTYTYNTEFTHADTDKRRTRQHAQDIRMHAFTHERVYAL